MPKLTNHNQECIDFEKETLQKMALALPRKDCRSKAEGERFIDRLKHLFIYRHWQHKCGMSRPFGDKHESIHECGRGSCNFMWLNSYGK